MRAYEIKKDKKTYRKETLVCILLKCDNKKWSAFSCSVLILIYGLISN